MKWLRAGGETLGGADEVFPSSESIVTKDFSISGPSGLAGQVDKKPDTGNIEEAESSLRESGVLNYEVGLIIVPSPSMFSVIPNNRIWFILCYLL